MNKNLSTELNALLKQYKDTVAVLRQELSERELEEIGSTINRMEALKVVVSVFGETNSGKSALLNSLLGFNNDNDTNTLPFSVDAQINKWDDEIEKNNRKIWKEVSGLEIVLQDTPGIAGDDSSHLTKAKKMATSSDIVLYVFSEAIKGDQVRVMNELLSTQKPVIFVLNKIDKHRPNEIEATKKDLITKAPNLKNEMIVLTAGHPVREEPIIDDLVETITSIVEYNQSELIGGTIENFMNQALKLAAERKIEKIDKERRRIENQNAAKALVLKTANDTANGIIIQYAAAASLLAAAIPLRLDFITTTLISGGMSVHIFSVFSVAGIIVSTTMGNQPDTKLIIKQLGEAAIQMLFANAAAFPAYIAISIGLKSNPFSYWVGSLLDSAFTFFIVSVVGYSFSFYCANNLSWGEKQNATQVLKEFIRKYIDELFINKIPEKYREQVRRLINPDLL